MSGTASGTSGWRTFVVSFAAISLIVGAVNTIDVLTIVHEHPQYPVAAPLVWEGSSWLTWIAFLWIAWGAFRLAPPRGRPWWRMLIVHPVGAVLFSLAHVMGFQPAAPDSPIGWAARSTISGRSGRTSPMSSARTPSVMR